MKRFFVALPALVLLTTSSPMAMSLPMTPADVQAALHYGATTPMSTIAQDPASTLGDGPSDDLPWGFIDTPYQMLAFASAQAHAAHRSVEKKLVHELQMQTTFDVVAYAFDTEAHMDDDMDVVIEQNGKTIQPVKKQLKSGDQLIDIGTEDPGYKTSLDATFSYTSVDLHAPFFVLVKVPAGSDGRFSVDPTKFR